MNPAFGDSYLAKAGRGEEFRLVANGFFQAEGHISCRIRGKYFSPVFVVNQNLTAKSLEFFF